MIHSEFAFLKSKVRFFLSKFWWNFVGISRTCSECQEFSISWKKGSNFSKNPWKFRKCSNYFWEDYSKLFSRVPRGDRSLDDDEARDSGLPRNLSGSWEADEKTPQVSGKTVEKQWKQWKNSEKQWKTMISCEVTGKTVPATTATPSGHTRGWCSWKFRSN